MLINVLRFPAHKYYGKILCSTDNLGARPEDMGLSQGFGKLERMTI